MGITSGVENKNKIIKSATNFARRVTEIRKRVSVNQTNLQRTTSGQAFKTSTRNLTAGQTRLRLNAQLNANQNSRSNSIDQGKVDTVRGVLIDADNLATALNPSPDFNEELRLNRAERLKLVGDLVRDGDANLLLDHNGFNGVRNQTYDNQRVIADTLGDAYRSGEISDADLNTFLEKVGPERASEFVLTLTSDPDNTFQGGIVEAVGEQAQSLGYEETAALAFSSSESLIREHLPDSQSRQATFSHIENYIENHPVRENPRVGLNPGGGEYRAEFTLAVTNAARLSAYGDGYSQSDFDNLLQDVGPGVANEIIARSASVIGDRRADGALEYLGRSSARIAENSDGDDKTRWEVNQYTAFTQNSILMSRNLTTESERMKAFDVLNRELARSRDDVNDSVEQGFSLLSYPIETNGLSRLLERHGTEILDAKLGTSGTNYEGQADLVNFLQSTLYSPISDTATTNRIKRVIGNYIEDTFTAGGNGDVRAGERIGALMGLHDVAFQRAFEAASTPEGRSRIEQLQVDITKTILSKAASTLLAPTGPVGSTAGGFVVGQVLNELFKDRSPSAAQLGREFLQLLEDRGIDINDASNYRDNLVEVVNVISESLQNQLDDLQRLENPTPEQQRQIDNIQTTLITLGDIESNFRDRSLETQNEYRNTNGRLREALENW